MEQATDNGTRQPVLVGPAILARELSVSVRTIRRLRARGRIPVIHVTRNRPRYSIPDVIRALNDQNTAKDPTVQ